MQCWRPVYFHPHPHSNGGLDGNGKGNEKGNRTGNGLSGIGEQMRGSHVTWVFCFSLWCGGTSTCCGRDDKDVVKWVVE